jgi:hypothetical protein
MDLKYHTPPHPHALARHVHFPLDNCLRSPHHDPAGSPAPNTPSNFHRITASKSTGDEPGDDPGANCIASAELGHDVLLRTIRFPFGEKKMRRENRIQMVIGCYDSKFPMLPNLRRYSTSYLVSPHGGASTCREDGHHSLQGWRLFSCIKWCTRLRVAGSSSI